MEQIPADEAVHVERVLALFRRVQDRHDRSKRPVPRSVRSKQHACVYAELRVRPDLGLHLRNGVFQAGAIHPALVRFSNAKQRDDRLPDAHGLAVKLLDVPGEKLLPQERAAPTQDFVLVDHPVFFAPDAAGLVPLMDTFCRLLTGGVFSRLGAAARVALSRDPRFRLARTMAGKRPENLLQTRFWSGTPSRWQDRAAKLSLRPLLTRTPPRSTREADRYRLAMVEHLQRGAAVFDVLVQLQRDPVRNPLEDATVEWQEALSPFENVGSLVIPPQAFDTVEQQRFGEQLSFSPWHALPEHKPLGGINRTRRQVYETLSAQRLSDNQVPKREPTLEEVRGVFPAARNAF